MEAMNNGYFAASNVGGGSGIVSVDLGSGATVTAAELAAYCAGNHHLSGPARRQEGRFGAMTPSDVDMGCRFDGAGGGSCSAASLRCHSQSGGMAVWPPSSKAPAYSIWSSSSSASDRPRTGSVHEPSYLAGIPDAPGFRYSHACSGGGGPSAPSTSALSLTLCSQSSSDSVLHTADGCSSVASRSALTELPQASHPPARSTPAPFATVVARSRYAAVAQEVLNDFVGRLLDGVSDSGSSGIDSWSVDASSEDAGARAQRVRTDLLNLLEMVDQKYNQCLDEIRSTTAKFNGLMPHGSASNGSNIRAQFAHRVSSMYLGLKRRIAGEIMAASRPTCWGESSSATAGHMERSWESASIQKRAAAARRGEQQSWLPHRGLPERSVAVLKAWMFEHFLKPYPDDREKDMLALRTGLTRAQVSNWFINARVRIWKPLIEEMYKDLERSSAGERGMGMEPRQNLMGRAIVLEGGP